MARRIFTTKAMMLDSYDQLCESCAASADYPRNLVAGTTTCPRQALDSWSKRLCKDGEKIFDDEEAGLDIIEMYDGETGKMMTCQKRAEEL